MTASSSSAGPSKASPVMWVGLLVVAAAIMVIAFSTSGTPSVGGFADPDGTGPEGLRGLRLFIEEAGGDTLRNVGLPTNDVDVAVLANQIELRVSTGDEIESWEPLLDWVRGGGSLITSIDQVEGGPQSGFSFAEDEDAVVERGVCTASSLAGIETVRPLAYSPVMVEQTDESCFGDGQEAVVVIRPLGDGQIVRVASMGMFFNRALDDADNGAIAARVVNIDESPLVAFLPEPPIFFVRDPDANVEVDGPEAILRDVAGEPVISIPGFGRGGDGPVDSEGNPIGRGEKGLLDLVDPRVVAMIVGLAVAALLYALARGRRLGSPIVEPLPIQLPSSTYVDAVGRLYGRSADARSRSAGILRHDLRTDLARRVGMSTNATAQDIAGALVVGDEHEALMAMLDGPAPTTDAGLVSLASQLVATRDRIDRGGVAALTQSEQISIAPERITDG
ncbi:MAG: hypothetical protein ACI81L_001910 [Verrucomicrobiales bacterium]|jgi:hypothetical protein